MLEYCLSPSFLLLLTLLSFFAPQAPTFSEPLSVPSLLLISILSLLFPFLPFAELLSIPSLPPQPLFIPSMPFLQPIFILLVSLSGFSQPPRPLVFPLQGAPLIFLTLQHLLLLTLLSLKPPLPVCARALLFQRLTLPILALVFSFLILLEPI